MHDDEQDRDPAQTVELGDESLRYARGRGRPLLGHARRCAAVMPQLVSGNAPI
jgi:hypothetical protein